MNLLESLANGLRGAGSVISPRVYEEMAREKSQEDQLKKQLAVQKYQQTIKDERDQRLAAAVQPHLSSGDYQAAATAAMGVPGGASMAPQLLQRALDERKFAESERAKRIAEARSGGFTIGNTRYDADGNVIVRGEDKPASASSLGKLISERDSLPQGDPRRALYDRAIEGAAKGSGVTVNVNPNAPLVPGKTAQNDVDKSLLDAGMRLQRLNTIENQYKSSFLEIPERLNVSWSSVKEKMGVGLDPVEKQKLTDFSQFKRNAIDALNEYIKSITGAAMSQPEAERILKGLPNPGQGLFDGDSPTEFKAKMDDAIKQTRLAEARLVYIKRNGFELTDIPLTRMPAIMDRRGAELEKEIRARDPQMNVNQIRSVVRDSLAREFGLVR